MTGKTHASVELIGRYVRGDDTISVEAEWSLETHLETCASCRARLAEVTAGQAPEAMAMLDTVWAKVTPAVTASRPVRTLRLRMWLATWASPAMIPWIVGATVVAVLAAVFGRPLAEDGDSVLFLLAPVVPVFGVAAVWSKAVDPMHELIAVTPRSGLYLLLRRTVAVLVLAMPLLAVASLSVGTSPLLWLLPSLACTLASLALGSVIGTERAAMAIAAIWLIVFTPMVLINKYPPLFHWQWSTPMWTGILVLAAAVVLARGAAFNRISSSGKAF